MTVVNYIEVDVDFYKKYKDKYPEAFPERSWIWYNKGYGSGSYYYYFSGGKGHPLYKDAILHQDCLKVKGCSPYDLPEGIKKLIPNNLGDVKIQGSQASFTGRFIISVEPYGFNVNREAYSKEGVRLSGINPIEIERKNKEARKRAIEKKIVTMTGKPPIKVRKGGKIRLAKVSLTTTMRGGKRIAIFLSKDVANPKWSECYESDKSYLLDEVE